MNPDQMMETLRQLEARIANLTHEEGAAWDRAGKLIGLKTGEAWLEWNDEEIEAMADGVMTHNHPSGLPPALSDYRMAVLAGLKEMRIVTKEGVWVIRPPTGGWPGSTMAGRTTWWERVALDLRPALLEKTVPERAHHLVVLFRQVTGAEVILG
jgi:hypothetical protein